MSFLAKLLSSKHFWSALQQLFLPPSARPFLVRLLRDYDGSGVFFCSANVITLVGLLLVCAAMMGANYVISVVLGV
ncbi:hypothetical protein EON65_52535 [archaeon]|nr:MAG: hypothetical protein EON65_52535 [archaeon]